MASPNKIISYEVIPSNAVKYFSDEGFETYLVTEGHLIALDDEGKLWHFNYGENQGWHCLN